MSRQLTEADARQSLSDHVAVKAAEIRAKYGPRIGWQEMTRMLEDRSCVRYPCEIVFAEGALQAGEFAYPAPKGESPEDGFTMYVHPFFATQPEKVPYLVLYQLVQVNYGAFASPADAEIFGATILGLGQEEYYAVLCEMADQVGGGEEQEAHTCGSSACGCGAE